MVLTAAQLAAEGAVQDRPDGSTWVERGRASHRNGPRLHLLGSIHRGSLRRRRYAAFARQSLEQGSVGPGIIPRQVTHLLRVDHYCDSVTVVLVAGLRNEHGNAPTVMTVDGLATADAQERLLVVRFTDDGHFRAAAQLDRVDLERLGARLLSPGVPLE